MWTKGKSTILSLICTRILICAAILVAAALPFFITDGSAAVIRGLYYGVGADDGILYVSGIDSNTLIALYICAYASFVPVFIALFNLDALLRSIRMETVFIRANVKRLRVISWCCYAIAIIMICGWPSISYVLIFVAAGAAFSGLIVRVVKNVIDAACEIKDENDLTV